MSRSQDTVELLRVVETITPGNNSGTWIYTYNHFPFDGVAFPPLLLLSPAYPVTHEWTIYADHAVETYSGGTGVATHKLTNLRTKHFWKGKRLIGFSIFDYETTSDSAVGEWVGNSAVGGYIPLNCSAGYGGSHVVTAHLMGDPVQWPMTNQGYWEQSISDGFVTVKGKMSYFTEGATARATSGGGSNPNVFAWGQVGVTMNVCGRCAFEVNFQPRNMDGSARHGEAMIVVGPMNTTGFDMALQDPAWIENYVTNVTTPTLTTVAYPLTDVGHTQNIELAGGWITPPYTQYIWVNIDKVYDPPMKNGHTWCAVIWKKKEFGLPIPANILEELDWNVASGTNGIPAVRFGESRFIDAAGTTFRRRVNLKLAKRIDLTTLPWRTGPMLTTILPDNVLNPGSGEETYTTYLGKDGTEGQRTQFKPYRFLYLDFNSTAQTTCRLRLEWLAGASGGFKDWTLLIKPGRHTIAVDLRDPDAMNGFGRSELPKLDQVNQASFNFMPPAGPSKQFRFGGVGLVNRLSLKFAGTVLRVEGAWLEASEALFYHHRGGSPEPVHTMVDGADALRVGNQDSGVTWAALATAGVAVTDKDLSDDNGWQNNQGHRFVSNVDKDFNLIPPGDLLAGCPLYSTGVAWYFQGYWGMSQDKLIGGSPVRVDVEYMWGHRFGVTILPPATSRIRLEGIGVDGTIHSITDDGYVINDHQDLANPSNSYRAYCPDQAALQDKAVLDWSRSNNTYTWFGLDARSDSEKPSHDRNAAQRHFRGFVRNGKLWLGTAYNVYPLNWEDSETLLRSTGVATRIDKENKKQVAYILNEAASALTLYKTDISADLSLEWVMDVGTGIYPALVILPGNRKGLYWLAGGQIVGMVLGGQNEVQYPLFVVGPSETRPFAVAYQPGKSGKLRVVLTRCNGVMEHLYSNDGVIFSTDASEPNPADAEIALDHVGHRFIYKATPIDEDGNRAVFVSILDQAGTLIIQEREVYRPCDPGKSISACLAVVGGGATRIALTVTQAGQIITVFSVDGLVFA